MSPPIEHDWHGETIVLSRPARFSAATVKSEVFPLRLTHGLFASYRGATGKNGFHMPENLFGLPTHVLLQHVVVVLLPIAAVSAILVALWAWYRHHLGVVTVLGTLLVTLFVPLTTQSGESLEGRLPRSPVIEAHAAAGDRVLWVAAAFGLSLFAVVALDLRGRIATTERLAPAESWVSRRVPSNWRTSAPTWTSTAFWVARVALVIVAVGVVVVIVQAGHSGANAVWSNYPNLSP